jgi:hypothetical protein
VGQRLDEGEAVNDAVQELKLNPAEIGILFLGGIVLMQQTSEKLKLMELLKKLEPHLPMTVEGDEEQNKNYQAVKKMFQIMKKLEP